MRGAESSSAGNSLGRSEFSKEERTYGEKKKEADKEKRSKHARQGKEGKIASAKYTSTLHTCTLYRVLEILNL